MNNSNHLGPHTKSTLRFFTSQDLFQSSGSGERDICYQLTFASHPCVTLENFPCKHEKPSLCNSYTEIQAKNKVRNLHHISLQI